MNKYSKHNPYTFKTSINNRGWTSELELIYGLVNLSHQNISSIVNETKNTNFQFIGRAEKIALPDFDIKSIKVKIDTGAYTSAIHALNIRVEYSELFFNLNGVEFNSKEYTTASVKSSNGDVELRYMIKTPIIIGGKRLIIESTLSDRSNMKYPILIGRKFLSDNKFMVDVTSKYLLKKKKDDRPK